MAVLSYYYFGEKTNDGARLRYVKRRGETESQGPRYNVSRYAWDRVGACIYARALQARRRPLSLSLFLIFGVSLRTTDRAENIGTPYMFPETPKVYRSDNAGDSRENKNKPVNNMIPMRISSFPVYIHLYVISVCRDVACV